MRKPLRLVPLLLVLAGYTLGQQNPPAQPQPDTIRPTYVLGAGDQLVIRANEVEEISDKPFSLDADGFITLPLLGRIKAGGSSVQQLEADLVERLRMYVRSPQVI